MKKEIKLILVPMMVLMMSVRVLAGGPSFHIYADDKKVNVEALGRGRTLSYVKSESGEVLLKRRMKKDGTFSMSFDLADFEEGKYMFVLEDQYRRQSVPFEISEQKLTIDQENTERVDFPQFVEEGKDVLVKLIADESNDLFIDIKSDSGDLLFQEKIDGKCGLIGKRFTFNPGKYSMTLISKNYTETKYLTFK